MGRPIAVNPPLGNASNITFKNISLEGTQKYRSEIKGQDANNGFHNVVLDNVAFGGEVVTPANLARYFDVNAYVSGLSFRAGESAPQTPRRSASIMGAFVCAPRTIRPPRPGTGAPWVSRPTPVTSGSSRRATWRSSSR